jgi:hypothetical protein
LPDGITRRFRLYYCGLIRKSIASIKGLDQYDQNDNVKLMAKFRRNKTHLDETTTSILSKNTFVHVFIVSMKIWSSLLVIKGDKTLHFNNGK